MKRFVIMLDSLVDLVSESWPVTLQDDNVEVLRAAQVFDGNPILFSPRAQFRLRLVESKSLTHALRPFEDHKGAIYEHL